MRVFTFLLSVGAIALAGFSLYSVRQDRNTLRQYSEALATEIRGLNSAIVLTRNEIRSSFEFAQRAQRPEPAMAAAKQELEKRGQASATDPEVQKQIEEVKAIRPESLVKDPEARAKVQKIADDSARRAEEFRKQAQDCVAKLVELRNQVVQAETSGDASVVASAKQALDAAEVSCQEVAKKAEDADLLRLLVVSLLRVAALAALAEGNPALAYALWTAADGLEAGGGGGGGGSDRRYAAEERATEGVPQGEAPPVVNRDGDVVPAPAEGTIVPGLGGEYALWVAGNVLFVKPRTEPARALGRLSEPDATLFRSRSCYGSSLALQEKRVMLTCINGKAVAITFE